MKSLISLIIMSVLMLCLGAIAMAADPSAPIPVIGGISAWLSAPPAWVSVILGVLIEISARIWPTKSPAGLVHALSGALSLASAGLAQLAGLVKAAADFSDKYLPQNGK